MQLDNLTIHALDKTYLRGLWLAACLRIRHTDDSAESPAALLPRSRMPKESFGLQDTFGASIHDKKQADPVVTTGVRWIVSHNERFE